jgi:hypothetical protein
MIIHKEKEVDDGFLAYDEFNINELKLLSGAKRSPVEDTSVIINEDVSSNGKFYQNAKSPNALVAAFGGSSGEKSMIVKDDGPSGTKQLNFVDQLNNLEDDHFSEDEEEQPSNLSNMRIAFGSELKLR